jgi:hypothetical protein
MKIIIDNITKANNLTIIEYPNKEFSKLEIENVKFQFNNKNIKIEFEDFENDVEMKNFICELIRENLSGEDLKELLGEEYFK